MTGNNYCKFQVYLNWVQYFHAKQENIKTTKRDNAVLMNQSKLQLQVYLNNFMQNKKQKKEQTQ